MTVLDILTDYERCVIINFAVTGSNSIGKVYRLESKDFKNFIIVLFFS